MLRFPKYSIQWDRISLLYYEQAYVNKPGFDIIMTRKVIVKERPSFTRTFFFFFFKVFEECA